MLRELERAEYRFTAQGAEYSLRYGMRAFLTLEKAGLSWRDIFAQSITGEALCAFLEAGGIPRERAAELLRRGEVHEIWAHCRRAVLLALPARDPDVIEIPKRSGDDLATARGMKRLRCFVCDVMRKPESFFWESTMRELIERWQEFAVAKGYSKEPERVQRFDTEGME